MRSICIYWLFVLAFCHLSCSQNSEEYYLETFQKMKKDLPACMDYIQRSLINTSDRAQLNRKSVLVCGNQNKFEPDDYRICDSILEKFMLKYNITSISVEKDVCFSERNFDLIIFELRQPSGISNNTNYYFYNSYCNSYANDDKGSNFKNIPIEENWSLFMEK